jgi:hypothetical protein
MLEATRQGPRRDITGLPGRRSNHASFLENVNTRSQTPGDRARCSLETDPHRGSFPPEENTEALPFHRIFEPIPLFDVAECPYKAILLTNRIR